MRTCRQYVCALEKILLIGSNAKSTNWRQLNLNLPRYHTSSYLTWICMETAESTASSRRLNSSKHPHAPHLTRPTKILPIDWTSMPSSQLNTRTLMRTNERRSLLFEVTKEGLGFKFPLGSGWTFPGKKWAIYAVWSKGFCFVKVIVLRGGIWAKAWMPDAPKIWQ